MLDRIVALIVKELASLWKDRKTRMILLVPPLIQVMIFAYAATFDVSHAPLGIWNEDRGAQAAELVRRFAASPAFTVVAAPSEPMAAAAALDAKRVAGVLHIGEKFSADLLAGRQASVQLLLDARRSNTALLIDGYATSIVAQFVLDQNPSQPLPIVIATRDWFNPAMEPKWFILPGLVAILSLMMSMLVSALSLSRERELGTFEQLLVTPLRPHEVLTGKAVPAIIVGMLDANIVIAAALLWFRLPFVGNPLLLEASLLIYMVAGVGIGLAISSFTRTQQQAMLGVFTIASPSIVLSGYAAPVENMPASVEWLSRVDPIRYMLIIARGTFLQDMPFAVALHSVWPMALIAAVLMSIAVVAVRRAVT